MNQDKLVYDFQVAMGQPRAIAVLTDQDHQYLQRVVNLELTLIAEEAKETMEALMQMQMDLMNGNNPTKAQLVELLDGLADLKYVCSHCANAFGMDLDGAFEEVHRSNMSKLDEHGNPIRNEVGKVMKGPNYSPPNLEKFV